MTYQICEADSVGNTQSDQKTRLEYHFSAVQQLVHTGKKSNTFAEHYMLIQKI